MCFVFCGHSSYLRHRISGKPTSRNKHGLCGSVTQKTVKQKELLAPTQEAKTQSCAHQMFTIPNNVNDW